MADSQASVSYPFASIDLASTPTLPLPLTLGVGRPLAAFAFISLMMYCVNVHEMLFILLL